MKSYEKPRLMFLSLSGNDQLCGSCAEAQERAGVDGILLHKDPTGIDAQIIDEIAGNNDDHLTREEAMRLFGNGEQDCEKWVDMYCKFTSTGLMVAWS